MAEQSDLQVGEVLKATSKDLDNLSIDWLVHEILTSRIAALQEETTKEIKELKERQREVNELHDLIAKINKMTEKDGKVKMDDELREMLEKAITNPANSEALNELKIDKDSIKFIKTGDKYSTDDRQRLIENIRMHIEDLNTQNDMQLQTVTKLTNERYETYQMARAIMKPLDEDKKQKARAIAGR